MAAGDSEIVENWGYVITTDGVFFNIAFSSTFLSILMSSIIAA